MYFTLSATPSLSYSAVFGHYHHCYVGGDGNRRLNAGVMSVTLLAGEDSLPLSVGPTAHVPEVENSSAAGEPQFLNRIFAGDNTLL